MSVLVVLLWIVETDSLNLVVDIYFDALIFLGLY